jgi:hypothetical protein
MIGFIDTSWCKYTNYNQQSAVADLHTFQFTAAHALGFSVSISPIPVNTESITSNHYAAFLPLPGAVNSEDSTKFSSDKTLHGNSNASSQI